ncbi:hypothetical protein [Spartinivicinus ruber]|uniref:hypothetical protein n=1 Tax=Spartinivicinus ruber TaxID=2683272 RepID=UPI0013D32844|nr:hypothetical protein [Spartinivicinus ruber]
MVAVTAEWKVQLWVNCPACKMRFDFIDTEEYHILDHDDLIPAKTQSGLEIKSNCPRCEQDFYINNTVYY